jgi:chemotaxis protein MotC
VRRLLHLAAAATAIALAVGGPAPAQDGKGEPFELVRSLQSLQDQIARGNTRAHATQRVLMARIAEHFAAAAPEAWKEPKNARAALVFVLSGGNASVVQKLLDGGAKFEIEEKLLKGALAYSDGRMDEAGELLGGIEARALDAGIAGHVAFVQAELVAKSDPAKAFGHLDDARLLAPGTLVEEASFRRQLALVGPSEDAERYETLAALYLRRFPNSLYAGSFRQQFAAAIAGNVRASESDRLARLEAMLGGVGPAERRDVYLTIAKEALLKGKVGIAAFAAASAGKLADAGSVEEARARVYEGAALVVSDRLDKGVEMLGEADRSKLAQTDAALVDAGLAVADAVQRAPASPDPEDAQPKLAGTVEQGAAASAVVARAHKIFAQVDEMLSEARK